MMGVNPEGVGYLGATSSIATRGTVVTGRSLWKSSKDGHLNIHQVLQVSRTNKEYVNL